ncbi:MAG: hypothetical protein F6K21_32305 [Symploca sp. SIO2D2]|nr:hypothetical protein [Symploca sp. SIO2D2]
MSPHLEEVLHSIDQLSTPEQLEIISHITNRLKQRELKQPKRKWLDLAGTSPYPLLGEDAQVWVSRSRREDQEQRDRLRNQTNEN